MNEATAIRRIESTELPVETKSLLIEQIKSAPTDDARAGIVNKATGAKKYQTKVVKKIPGTL